MIIDIMKISLISVEVALHKKLNEEVIPASISSQKVAVFVTL